MAFGDDTAISLTGLDGIGDVYFRHDIQENKFFWGLDSEYNRVTPTVFDRTKETYYWFPDQCKFHVDWTNEGTITIYENVGCQEPNVLILRELYVAEKGKVITAPEFFQEFPYVMSTIFVTWGYKLEYEYRMRNFQSTCATLVYAGINLKRP